MIKVEVDTYGFDPEMLRRMCDEIRNACVGVEVGFQADGGTYNNGKNVVEVATINEYGYGHNPPRPFMHATLETNKNKYEMLLREGFYSMHGIDKNKISELSSKMGQTIKEDIQQTIENWQVNDPRPNKDGSRPLIDTGKMKDSVEWRLLLGDET